MTKLSKEKIRQAAEAVSHSHEDRTLRDLMENPKARATKRLHIKDRIAITFHISPLIYEFLSVWARKHNLSRSWYILRCVIEGLMRDARLDPQYLVDLDRPVHETRLRPREKAKRQARAGKVRDFIHEKQAAKRDEEDPHAWLRGL
jgi:hypothetical protein